MVRRVGVEEQQRTRVDAAVGGVPPCGRARVLGHGARLPGPGAQAGLPALASQADGGLCNGPGGAGIAAAPAGCGLVPWGGQGAGPKASDVHAVMGCVSAPLARHSNLNSD